MNKRIEEIIEKREELLNELYDFQDNCEHEDYRIGLYSWRIGSIEISRICNECGKNIGEPSQDEIDKYNSENKN